MYLGFGVECNNSLDSKVKWASHAMPSVVVVLTSSFRSRYSEGQAENISTWSDLRDSKRVLSKSCSVLCGFASNIII